MRKPLITISFDYRQINEITGLLGEGGFARVYRAIQHEPVQRTVALKVLKPGLHGLSVRQRFQRERQALAALDHPETARALGLSTASRILLIGSEGDTDPEFYRKTVGRSADAVRAAA